MGVFFVSRILFYVNEPGIVGIVSMHISYWLTDELGWTSYLRSMKTRRRWLLYPPTLVVTIYKEHVS